MERLLSRLQSALNQQPLNLDYLEFLTRHNLILFGSFSEQIGGVSEITEALQNLHHVVQREINPSSMPIVELETEVGAGPGPPQIVIEKENLKFAGHISASLLHCKMPWCFKKNCVQENERIWLVSKRIIQFCD